MMAADLKVFALEASIEANACQAAKPAEFPVKNTFIHLDTKRSHGRCLRACSTDPKDPVVLSLASVKLQATPTFLAAPSDDSCSTTEPAVSEVDPLEAVRELMMPLDFHGAGLHTPEQTPRHSRDPWAWPDSTSSSPTTAPASAPALPSSMPSSMPATPPSAFGAAHPPQMPVDPVQFAGSPFCTPPPTPSASFFEFGMTLRLADDVGLGLDLAPRLADSHALVIQDVLLNGAISSWNRQCYGTAKESNAVRRGDAIVSVNGKTEYEEMVQECDSNHLLKLKIIRAVLENGTCFNAIPVEWYVPSMQVQSMFQRRGHEGERLHSCKKPASLFI